MSPATTKSLALLILAMQQLELAHTSSAQLILNAQLNAQLMHNVQNMLLTTNFTIIANLDIATFKPVLAKPSMIPKPTARNAILIANLTLTATPQNAYGLEPNINANTL
jgi:hypothetical protein